MSRVKQVKPNPGFGFEVEFEDGLAGVLDLSGELDGPVFEPLATPSFFDQVRLDEFGVICWPNGCRLSARIRLQEDLATLRASVLSATQPVHPVSRPALVVRHSQDYRTVARYDVNERKGELPKYIPPNAGKDLSSGLRETHYDVFRPSNFAKETSAQLRCLLFKIIQFA